MNKINVFAAVSVVLSTGILISSQAVGQIPGFKNYVGLQPTTPGTSQSGHVNISGTMRASELVGGGSGVSGVNANLLDGLDSTAFLQSVPNPLHLSGNGTLNGIIRGLNLSASPLSVAIRGSSQAASGLNYAGYFDNASSGGVGVHVESSGIAGIEANVSANFAKAGIFAASGSSGIAVEGSSTSASGSTRGGSFQVASTSGYAAVGSASSATGFTRGGYFTSASSTGIGVYGESTSNTTSFSPVGVYGTATGPAGFGVQGEAQAIGVLGRATGGSGNGVWGQANVVFGTGVKGTTNAQTGYGLEGVNSDNTIGVGIYGLAGAKTSGPVSNKIGVFGEANGVGHWGMFGFSTDSGVGVRGQSTGVGGVAINGVAFSGAVAGFFQGNTQTTGRIQKSYAGTMADAVPLAYGTVALAGTKVNGSDNWTVIWNAGSGHYEITITGETYSSNMTAIVTPIANAVPRIGGVAPVGSDLGVTWFTTAGAKVQVSFHFVVYDPQP